MKFNKIISLALVSILGFGLFLSLPVAADACSANVPESVKAAAGCNGNADQLPGIIAKIVTAVIAVLGIVAVIFIVVGGVNYMTSAGDPGKIQKARSTILYAVIGLIICALAFAIVNFVLFRI